MLESCYSTKEWLERRKQKALVKRELNKIRPSLGLINAASAFQQDQWKHFKADYNITSDAMHVLLEASGEEYFVAAKLFPNKNKPIEELILCQAILYSLLQREEQFLEACCSCVLQREEQFLDACCSCVLWSIRRHPQSDGILAHQQLGVDV